MKMKIILNWILLIYFFHVIIAKKHKDDDDTEKNIGNPAMDRLAVNLAGAFVKSIFPEMDRDNTQNLNQKDLYSITNSPSDVRRAPQHAELLQEASGPAFETLNAFNNRYGGSGGPAAPVLSSVNGGNYGLQLPTSMQSYGPAPSGPPLPTSQLADLIPNMPDALNVASGGIEGINAARRQKYLQELERHQHELNEYSAKQLEYLDQQRRYQQTMVDHQAGAALLLQQQQQQFLNGMKKKYAGFDDVERKSDSSGLPDFQTGGHILRRSKDKLKQHAVKTAAYKAFEENNSSEREPYASDDYLKHFFKKVYGIEIPNKDEMSKLSEDDRETLRQLKEHLIKEAKSEGIKLGAIKTMEKYAEKHTVDEPLVGDDLEKELAELENQESNKNQPCFQCLIMTPKKLKGKWIQVYGNPTVMKDTYSTILSLEKMNQLDKSREVHTVNGNHASCVGMKIGSFKNGESSLNLFFRDDGEEKLHEMNGTMNLLSSKEVKFNLDYMDTDVCIVKAGPEDSEKFEYVIFAEINGKNKCKNYLIFARNYDDFNEKYYDDISDFMKNQVINDYALPVAALPKPMNCES